MFRRIVSSVFTVLILAGTTSGGAAQTPGASPVAADSDWQIADVRALEWPSVLAGEIAALSPDGRWLAGFRSDNVFCVWDVEKLTPTCDAEVLPIDRYAIVWSPDSTAVAFSLDAEDSDIYVYELEAGRLTNLTDDGFEGSTGEAERDDPIDMLPTWSPDSQELAFVRSYVGGDGGPIAVMRVGRAGGEPVDIVQLDSDVSSFIPIFWLADDSILYSVESLNAVQGEDELSGLWRVGADGNNPERVVPGTEESDIPGAYVTDVSADSEVASVYSPSLAQVLIGDGIFWIVDLANGDRRGILPLDIEGIEAYPVAPAAFSPDGSVAIGIYLLPEIERTGLVLIDTATGTPTSLQSQVSAGDLPQIPARTNRGWAQWSESNTILVQSGDGPILLTLEQAP